jgi:3-oxoacyl-[acyl-carrier protein] reductase
MNPADGPAAEVIIPRTALGRFGAPEEIAATVSYLAGEQARFVTGAAITVDGGFNT